MIFRRGVCEAINSHSLSRSKLLDLDVKASLQNTFSPKCCRTSSVALGAEKVALKVEGNSSIYTFSSIGKGNRLKVFCKN